jgi:DNA repair protein RadC
MGEMISQCRYSRQYPNQFKIWRKLRDRNAKDNAVIDEEFLKNILQRITSSRSAETIAKAMIYEFGSIAAAINAPEHRLLEIPGVSHLLINEIKFFRSAVFRVMQSEVTNKPVLKSWPSLVLYCRAIMAFEKQEEFRIIFLDKCHRLIKDEVHQRGTIDHVTVYVREIVRRALQLGASAVIFAHGRPFRAPAPSADDIAMVTEIMKAMKCVGIRVYDHIIITRDEVTSFRSEKLI